MTPATLDLTLYKGATFGPITLVFKDSENAVVDLSDYQGIEAHVRSAGDKPLVLDLEPAITDAENGTAVIELADEETAAIRAKGNYAWDLFLINEDGERLGPFLAGKFTITTPITLP